MRKGALARRYANALVDLAMEEKDGAETIARFGKELRDLLAIFKGSPILYKVLLNPMYPLEERLSLSVKVSVAVGTSEIIKRFFSLLVEARNVKLLEEVTASYARKEDELAGRLRATVEAPSTLDKKLLKAIKDRLESETKKEVVLGFKENPALIGGVVIRLGNTVFEGSLRAQLEKMRETLTTGA